MENTTIINNFNAKTFNKYNKNLKDGDTICKMLVNYKWSVRHLQKLDESYAQTAVAQFNKMVKQFGVKLEAEKKETEKKENKK